MIKKKSMSITSLPANISDPKGVMAESVLKPLSVRVSWQAVKDADRYTVKFTKAMESFQEGPCKDYPHTVTLSVHCKKCGVPSTPIVVHTYGVHAHHTSSGVPGTPRLWCASTPVFYAHY